MPDAWTISTSNQFASHLTTYVRNALLSALRGGLVNMPAGVVDSDSYQRGHTDTYQRPGMADLDVVLTPLDEILPPVIENVESYFMQFSTVEYARAIGFSSKILRQQPFDPARTIAEKVARNVLEVADEVARLEWQAAHAGEAIIGDGTADLKTDDLINATAWLTAHDIPPLSDGTYACISNAWAVAALRKETGEKSWVDAVKYASPQDLIRGHLGTWQGISFYASSRNNSAGANATSIVAGQAALAFADPSSLQTFTVLPTATITDPVAQKGIASWRARLGAKVILRTQRQKSAVTEYSHVKLFHKNTIPAGLPA
jgi:N4-gp56 family major capsid protein